RSVKEGHFFKQHVQREPVGGCTRERIQACIEDEGTFDAGHSESGQHDEDRRTVGQKTFVHCAGVSVLAEGESGAEAGSLGVNESAPPGAASAPSSENWAAVLSSSGVGASKPA